MGRSGHIRVECRGASLKDRLLLLLAAAVLAAGRAYAGCIDTPFADLHPLAALEETDANQALDKAGSLIAASQHDHTIAPIRLAALYAIAAQSSSILELDADARAAASKGLVARPAG